jgi:hypothetical protein
VSDAKRNVRGCYGAPTMLMKDAPEEMIVQALTDSIAVEERRIFRACHELVWRGLKPDLQQGERQVEAQRAGELVAKSIAVLDERIRGVVRRRSSFHWLWMLRRLPVSIFEGELASTLGYDQTLAETATGRALEKDDLSLTAGFVANFPVNPAVLRDLAELCSLTRFTSDLHRAYRWAAKGAALRFDPHARPAEVAEASLRAAVELYDRRMIASSRPVSRQGSDITQAAGAVGEPGVLLLVNPITPAAIKLDAAMLGRLADQHPDLAGGAKVVARFWPSLTSVPSLLSLNPSLSREQLAVVLLLHTAALHMHRHRAGLFSVATRGYLLVETSMLQDQMAAFVDIGGDELRDRLAAAGIRTVEDLWTSLRRARGNTWPLMPGPVLRECGGSTALDLAAATKFINTLEADPAPGDVANQRGNHFEHAVQAAIDKTPWRPDASLAALRGRTLELRGKAITDIDAIGARGSTLLAVSCKSVVYRGLHDKGDHAAVRNMATLVENAVTAWSKKMDVLASAPAGANYDLSRYRSILGVVCTPTVPYLPIGSATAFVTEGLRAASSYTELVNWLPGGQPIT